MSLKRFMDVVNWDVLVAPGVVLCKDGTLLAGWQVGGIDSESASPEDVQALRGHIATGLSHLGDRHTLWMVWQRRARPPAPLLAETGQTALDILADETNTFFASPGLVWQDSLILYLGWTPEGGGGTPDLAAFGAECAMLHSWLDPVLALSRIDLPDTGSVTGPDTGPDTGSNKGQTGDPVLRSELIGSLAALLGAQAPAPRLAPGVLPVGLDALMAPALVQRGAGGPVKIGAREVAVMSLSCRHEAYSPAPLEGVQDIDLPLIWVTRWRAMSPQTALKKARWIQKTRRQAGANLVSNIEGSGGGERSLFSDRMALRIEESKARIESGEEGYGDVLSVLLLYGPPGEAPQEHALRRIRERVQLAGFEVSAEQTGAVPVLLCALPGHATPTPRDAMTSAQVMADLMPVRGLWPGARTCPSPLIPPGTPALLPALTRSGELFHFNLHVDDVGHTLLFGPTGTGKSVLLGQIAAAWLRYPEAQVIVFDRNRSIRHACAALGGVFLEPGIGGGAGIAPLDQMNRLGGAWALDWLGKMVQLGAGSKPTPEQAGELRNSVGLMLNSGNTSLNRLAEMVQETGLRALFDDWRSGPYGGTFDSQGSDIAGGLAAAPLTVFETAPLFEARPAVTVLSLDYIFAEVAQRLNERPTLLILDEAWFFLAHEIFVERIRFWLKEGRKMNLAVVMATQSVSDAARSPIMADLLESCPTRLYLASPTASTGENAPGYRQVGLNDTGIATVAALRPKRELLMVQDRITRVLGFPLGPVGLSILGRTSKADSARAAREATRDPDFWIKDIRHEDHVRTALQEALPDAP